MTTRTEATRCKKIHMMLSTGASRLHVFIQHERLQCIFSTKPGWKSALWGTAILFRETRTLPWPSWTSMGRWFSGEIYVNFFGVAWVIEGVHLRPSADINSFSFMSTPPSAHMFPRKIPALKPRNPAWACHQYSLWQRARLTQAFHCHPFSRILLAEANAHVHVYWINL